MNLARYAIEKPLHTWLLISLCLLGGIWGTVTIGKLEDPAFTIKQAVIITSYPGATATEVEQEVTEPLETAIQQLAQLKELKSVSLPGRSQITVEIQDRYQGEQIPQVWDELRRKVNDAALQLPSGVNPPLVNDDFGDVFGLFYAITTDGYSNSEVRELARFLSRELLTVPGVAKVQTEGVPQESIYVDVPNNRLVSLNLPVSQITSTLSAENTVASAGEQVLGDRRVRLISRPGLDSVTALENLRIGRPGTNEQLLLSDLAEVSRQEVDNPDQLIRYNGQPAFTLAVSGQTDQNIVDIGKAVDAYLDTLLPRIPAGMEIHPVYQQHLVVADSINGFFVSLLLSFSIVIAAFYFSMGWRVGIAIGVTLLLTVLGTIFLMKLFEIEMERVSLGALIIAMGMLMDNAIVVTETMIISLQRGMSSKEAASEAARRGQLPLLGATVIGIMAFAGIGLSPDTTGEFLFSLFAVITISLLLSWVLAMTVVPLFGHYLFQPSQGDNNNDPYQGSLYLRYRTLVAAALRHRWKTTGLLAALTLLSVVGFGYVKQSFFPPSNTPLFYIDYFLPQGSDLRATERDIKSMEQGILAHPEVVSVTSFVGRGASRFMLTYSPEQGDPAFGHLIVRTQQGDQIPALMETLRQQFIENHPEALIYARRLMFGPGDGAKIEARFSGPDEQVLRRLAAEASAVLNASPSTTDVRQDWRQRELVIFPELNEERARTVGVNRTDLAQTLQFATVGIRTGTFREGDRQLPIVVRAPAHERLQEDHLDDQMIWSNAEQAYIPIGQVIDGFTAAHEEARIHRLDRVRTLTVQAEPVEGLTASEALNAIRADIERLTLPDGYRLEWGGEYENSRRSQGALGAQLPVSFLVMLVITLLLFNSIKQTLVIWLVVPMSICGVTAALLLTNMPFSFTALLGFLSLSGMLIKNAIVLVDEINEQLASQQDRVQAIIDACVSRIRPVLLLAATTLLGMLPLLWDPFFSSMAVTIMGGMAFATLLTLIAAPVLYALFYRIKAAPAADTTE